MVVPVEEPCRFPSEQIPDTAGLYLRVSRRAFVRNGKLSIGFFRNHPNPKAEDSMSSDWEKYSTAIETRERVREGTASTDYGIIRLLVGGVRAIPFQRVEHTPKNTNRAHSDIFGEKKDEQIRQAFYDIAQLICGFES